MKKYKKAIYLILVGVMCITVFASCASKQTFKTVYELPYYDGKTYEEGHAEPKYSADLWRRNNTSILLPDPQIMDNTAVDGYYYMCGTSGGVNVFETYRTKDLDTWEKCGVVLDLPNWKDTWAPEMIYDPDEKTYYLFFSSSFPGVTESNAYSVAFRRSLYVATSSSPTGPFQLVNYSDPESVGENNVREFNASDYDYNGNCAEYVKNVLFEPLAMNKALAEVMPDRYTADSCKLINNIDPSPFVDPVTHKKYLYFNTEIQPSAILCVEMENWLKPIPSTVKLLTRNGYYTVEDYDRAQNPATASGVETLWCEQLKTKINEGPFVYYRDGVYYLTYSCNGYADSTYSVLQAVSNSPTGPFRKLTENENGILLSADYGGNLGVGGTGHHSFFTVGEKLYVAYHKHVVPGTTDYGRCVAFDEVKFVSIKDKNGKDLDVMYVNGPTVTVQPNITIDAEYADISSLGTVKLLSGKIAQNSGIQWLNDGLLSYNTVVNQGFLYTYVQETEITAESTFEITFDSPQTVRAFMLYNSKFKENVIFKIKDIEIVTDDITYYIRELNVDDKTCVKYNEFELLNGNYIVESVAFGSSIYAEFDAIADTTAIRFTVEIPTGQQKAGISEIVVMGKVD